MLIDAALKLRGQFVKLTTIKCTIGDLLCTFPEQFSHIILCYASNIKEIILFIQQIQKWMDYKFQNTCMSLVLTSITRYYGNLIFKSYCN